MRPRTTSGWWRGCAPLDHALVRTGKGPSVYFTENRTHRLHRNRSLVFVPNKSCSRSRVTRRRARRVFPRWKKYPAMQTRGWWRPDGALASTTRSSSERTRNMAAWYFIQRKADSRKTAIPPVERRARQSSFFLGLAAVSSTRRRARLGGSPLPRSVCSRRCLGCAAWSSLRTHRASGRPRTCTRTARR